VTAESRRPLGYGLLGGAAGLTLLLLLWLATSGAQAGGTVLGLVLVFVLAGPLAGGGWYVLARANADVVEERAFCQPTASAGSGSQVGVLEQYDDLVWQRVRWLRDHADDASVPDAVDHLQQAIDQRSDLLVRGQQAASVAPSTL